MLGQCGNIAVRVMCQNNKALALQVVYLVQDKTLTELKSSKICYSSLQ